jgi:hypothetical protein
MRKLVSVFFVFLFIITSTFSLTTTAFEYTRANTKTILGL